MQLLSHVRAVRGDDIVERVQFAQQRLAAAGAERVASSMPTYVRMRANGHADAKDDVRKPGILQKFLTLGLVRRVVVGADGWVGGGKRGAARLARPTHRE